MMSPLRMFFFRLVDYLITIPLRCWRLIKWLFFISPIRGKDKVVRWMAGIILLVIDLTPIPVFIESFLDLVKTKTRGLNDEETALATSVFRKKIPLHLIGVDPASIPARKGKTMAYVIFHTINFDTHITPATFIHELVHIWQYRTYGSLYISEALWAQTRGGGYNYGGIEALRKYHAKPGLCAFNFEQQADIIEEHFRLHHNLPLQWCEATDESIGLLTLYAGEVQG